MLLLHDPETAEQFAVEHPAVIEAIRAGHGAVEVAQPGQTPEYIIVQGGQRRTLSALPADWNGPVTRVDVTTGSETLLGELRALVVKLGLSGADWLPNVDPVVHTIENYRRLEPDSVEYVIAHTELPPEGLTGGMDVSADQIKAWAESSLTAVAEAFLRFRITGNYAARTRGGLWMFAASRDPAAMLRAVIPGAPASATRVLPPLIPRVLIGAGEAIGADGVTTAVTVARGLKKTGDGYRKDAIHEKDFVAFHQGLHKAFLMYRTAQMLFKAAVDYSQLRGNPTGVLSVSDQALLDICEEMRVIIANALLTGALDRPASPNLTEPERWEQWLRELRRIPLAEALNDVDSMFVSLLFPEWFRAVAEGCTRLDHAADHGDADRAITRAMQTCQELGLTTPDQSVALRMVHGNSLVVRLAWYLRREGRFDDATHLLTAAQLPSGRYEQWVSMAGLAG